MLRNLPFSVFSYRVIIITRKCYNVFFIAESTSKVVKIKKWEFFFNLGDFKAENQHG